MSSWIDLLTEAAPIRSIFGDSLPELEGVDLHEVVLHRDGPRVTLRFDLQQFPKCPPKKWMVAGFNRVQLRLLAVGIQDLSITGWQSQCRVSLSVFSDGSLIRVKTLEGEVKIEFSAESLMIDNVSAYCDQ